MISATDALSLPSARLTEEESEAADRLEVAIEVHARKFMELRGFDFSTKEKRPNVIAEINHRLKVAGWEPQWQMMLEPHPLNKTARVVTGFELHCAPSDAAIKAARELHALTLAV